MNRIKISVITVCYNAVTTIEETIKSVINQTYDNIEYIIIDGGSTDGTVDIIKKYTKKIAYWVSEPDKGIYDAMNKGIKIASGDFLNFMNAGDKFINDLIVDKVTKLIHSDDVILYGDTVTKCKNKLRLTKALDSRKLNKQGILCHQSAFTRVDYHKSHLFDLKYKVLADFAFFYKAYNYEKVKFHKLPIAISLFDMSDGGMSKSNYDLNYREFLDIIKGNISNFYIWSLYVKRILGKVRRRLRKC